jgi:hypothetical protein
MRHVQLADCLKTQAGNPMAIAGRRIGLHGPSVFWGRALHRACRPAGTSESTAMDPCTTPSGLLPARELAGEPN